MEILLVSDFEFFYVSYRKLNVPEGEFQLSWQNIYHTLLDSANCSRVNTNRLGETKGSMVSEGIAEVMEGVKSHDWLVKYVGTMLLPKIVPLLLNVGFVLLFNIRS